MALTRARRLARSFVASSFLTRMGLGVYNPNSAYAGRLRTIHDRLWRNPVRPVRSAAGVEPSPCRRRYSRKCDPGKAASAVGDQVALGSPTRAEDVTRWDFVAAWLGRASFARLVVAGELSSLTAVHRRMLELVLYDDPTQVQISAVTGIPLGTVKSHISRGFARLHARREVDDASRPRSASAAGAG
jgi:Sigma-70, region 4